MVASLTDSIVPRLTTSLVTNEIDQRARPAGGLLHTNATTVAS